MKLNDQQRKFTWIAVAVVAVLYFLPVVIRGFEQQNEGLLRGAKPPAGIPMTADFTRSPYANSGSVNAPANAGTAYAGVEGATSIDPEFAKVPGVWRGASVRPNGQGLCTTQLEIRLSADKPGSYKGYSTITCISNALYLQGVAPSKDFAADLSKVAPASSIMSGAVSNGKLQLHVDTNIGQTPDGCDPTDYVISIFGSDIAAIWKAGASTCQPGNMIMKRIQQ